MIVWRRGYLSSGLPRAASTQHRNPRQAEQLRNRSLIAFDEAAHLDLALIRFWNQDIVLVNREEWIHEVLVTQADAFRKGPLLTRNARPLLGNGLLTSDNELNRRQRRIISPAFAHRKVADYARMVVTETDRVGSSWDDESSLDITNEMLEITLGVIGKMLFGENLGVSSDAILKSIPILMNFAIDELRSPLQAVRSAPRALLALTVLNRATRTRITARRARGRPATDDDTDILDLLIFGHGSESSDAMPDRLVKDEFMTTFLAGLETVAVALTWTLYLLAMHPDACTRAQAEIDAIRGDIDYASLAALPYTLQVLKEALRLYPPAYIVARQATRDIVIGPHDLKRGAVVFISPYVRHRRPELFSKPLTFDPSRWTATDYERTLPRYAYMPFGGGAHICIGSHFALMEGHLILALLLRKFQFTLIPGQTVAPEPLFSLRPRSGIFMRAARR